MWHKIIGTFCFNDPTDNSIDQSAISLCKMEKDVSDFIKKEGYWIPGHYGKVVYNEKIFYNALGEWSLPDRQGKYFSFTELVKNLKDSGLET